MWTPRRVIAVAAGAVLLVVSLGLLGGGGVAAWADLQQRGGYLTTGTAAYSTGGYALASDPVSLPDGWGWAGAVIGDVRIRVTPGNKAVFAGIAPAGEVERYLTGVGYASVTAFGGHAAVEHPGTAAPPPLSTVRWVARAQGAGPQTLTWRARGGDWTAVVMNADGSPGVAVRADVGVTSPALPWLAGELLAAGVMIGLLAAALIVIPVRMASGRVGAPWPP